MYTMQQACRLTNLRYETLKFYCNEGLVPNVKRSARGHRLFDDRDIAWIQSLNCLKQCNMGIREMKEYLALCLQGEASIPARKQLLTQKRRELLQAMAELQSGIDFIDRKQRFYDEVLCGAVPYHSNLLPPEPDVPAE